jgi:hypothetical protein
LVIRLTRVEDHIGILTTQSDNPPLFFRENIFHDVTELEHDLSLPWRPSVSCSPIMLPSGAHTCDAIDGHAVLVAFGQLLIGATTIKERDDRNPITKTAGHLEVRFHLPTLGKGVMDNNAIASTFHRISRSTLALLVSLGKIFRVEPIDSIPINKVIISGNHFVAICKTRAGNGIRQRRLATTGQSTNQKQTTHFFSPYTWVYQVQKLFGKSQM